MPADCAPTTPRCTPGSDALLRVGCSPARRHARSHHPVTFGATPPRAGGELLVNRPSSGRRSGPETGDRRPLVQSRLPGAVNPAAASPSASGPAQPPARSAPRSSRSGCERPDKNRHGNRDGHPYPQHQRLGHEEQHLDNYPAGVNRHRLLLYLHDRLLFRRHALRRHRYWKPRYWARTGGTVAILRSIVARMWQRAPNTMKHTLRCHDFGWERTAVFKEAASLRGCSTFEPKSRQPSRGCGHNRR
jgi:hypothetical protein